MKSHATLFLFWLLCHAALFSQTYYARGLTSGMHSGVGLLEVTINGVDCDIDTIGLFQPFPNNIYGNLFCAALSQCPNGDLYMAASDGFVSSIYQLNPQDAFATKLFALPEMAVPALACNEEGTLYMILENELFIIDLMTNNMTLIGETGYFWSPGMVFFQGSLYFIGALPTFPTTYELAKMNVTNPLDVTPLFEVGEDIKGLSILPGSCDELLGYNSFGNLFILDIDSETMMPYCSILNTFGTFGSLSEPSDYQPAAPCPVAFDLDLNNSSGGTGNNFTSPSFTCFDNQRFIADVDAFIPSYPDISEMTISITAGLMDLGLEVLSVGLTPPGITSTGSTTTTLTLSNTSGTASPADFVEALQLVRYRHFGNFVTGGMREVTVSFVTMDGVPSELALCQIFGVEIPQVAVDLGDDITACAGNPVTITSNAIGLNSWNTGEFTPSIQAPNAGTYIVTVTDGVSCPGRDEVVVSYLPEVLFAVEFTNEICVGETGFISLSTFPSSVFDVDIFANGEYLTSLSNVVGGDTLFVQPTEPTTYHFEQVLAPNTTACFDTGTDLAFINVFPVIMPTAISENLCEGDSIFLAGAWQKEAGIFTDIFTSIGGCDSMVLSTVELLLDDSIFIFQEICDPNLAGIFTENYLNTNGCDSIVVKTLEFLGSDSVFIFKETCEPDSAGIFTENYLNINDCDSIVVTSVELLESDSIYFFYETCDPNLAGVFTENLINIVGCDSVVILTVELVPGDSVYVSGNTCEPDSAGVFTENYLNMNGCDSVVVTTVNLVYGDSIFIFEETCEPDSAGVFTENYLNMNGCDSIVVTSVELLESDSIYFFYETCDPSLAGVFTENLINIVGCDSVVVLTVELVPGDSVYVSGNTCEPDSVGVFTENYLNMNGCDSVVVTTVDLVYGDSVFISESTCDPSSVGIFTENYLNINGCDSVVILTVNLVPGDSTYVFENTCDPALAGIYTENLLNINGCDSVVIMTVELIYSDSIYVFGNTCDPNSAGIFQENYTNVDGCDSVVISTIELIIEDSIFISESTCDPSSAGVFTASYTNVDGCDSVVLNTIYLLPIDSCVNNERPLVYVPNIFSPNDDGINDVFFINADEQVTSICTFRIYSRWGELVFEQFNVLPNGPIGGWDGTVKNKTANAGLYVYFAEIELQNGTFDLLKGEVILAR